MASATESAAQATVDDLTAKMTDQQAVIDQARHWYRDVLGSPNS